MLPVPGNAPRPAGPRLRNKTARCQKTRPRRLRLHLAAKSRL